MDIEVKKTNGINWNYNKNIACSIKWFVSLPAINLITELEQ